RGFGGQEKSKSQLKSEKFLSKIDLIAVTVGPGLEPALWTGINFAKELYKELRIKNKKLKIIGTSHLDGHLYSNLLNSKSHILYPSINLIISGGHTTLLLTKDLTHHKKIGETSDDAVGECFDKVARLLKLPYPGGPEIEKLAKCGDSVATNFPRPMMSQKNYDFSFSGLKTSVLYYIRDNKNYKKEDVAASFQKAAFDVLINKTLRAADEYGAKSIMISGGVSANKTLAKEFKKAIKNKKFKTPYSLLITRYPTDNAAMIAVAGYISFLKKKNKKLVANGSLNL
ncbi:tRNA (adenosine(37)-N6)-threonylcarbamoyltransferase complex transferase subunit TsaD, partial [Candidatus Wolfebacteria bacterium]|nr:tRNA (adenosine(37)-N6)-threonylcarbamoyltransferase complex transferase subunit TsaD [Candidatus Wolfebacteria bacterium]